MKFIYVFNKFDIWIQVCKSIRDTGNLDHMIFNYVLLSIFKGSLKRNW